MLIRRSAIILAVIMGSLNCALAIEVSSSKKTVPEKFQNPNPKKLRLEGDVKRIHRANEVPYKQMQSEITVENLSGRRAKISFSVTNKTKRVVNLTFNTAKRYEMAVINNAGRVVHNTSSGKAYAEVIGTLMINPSDSAVYEEIVTLPPGSYKVKASIAGHEPLSAEKAFSIQ
jgi:uncharacterized protein YaiE (UPF0345 family)